MIKDYFSVITNIVKTCIGSGILFYPIFFSQLGIPKTLSLIFMSSMFSSLGLYLYVYCNHKRGKGSISTLAIRIKPVLKPLGDFVVITKTIIVVISYLNIAKSALIKNFLFFKVNVNIYAAMIFYCILLGLLICLKHVDALKYSSFVGISGIIYLISLTVYNFFTKSHLGSFFTEKSPSNLPFKYLTFFVFSFTCHQTILPIHNEKYHKSLKFFTISIFSSIFIVAISYAIFGILNMKIYDFRTFGGNQNYLDVLKDDKLGLLARLSYLVVISFSIPLQMIPCRDFVIPFLKKATKLNDKILRIFLAFFLIFFCLFMSNFSKIDFLQRMVGGTSSNVLCFILPSLYYLFLKGEKSKILKYLSYLNILFGFVVFLSFFYSLTQ